MKEQNTHSPITVSELQSRLQTLSQKNEIILDVRTPEEFGERSILGSKNIPLSELTEHISALQQYATVYCICYSGGRSEVATALLQATNIPAVNVEGGMKAWVAAGYSE